MGKTIMGAVVSLDGYIARDDDSVGPLFDWYGNGDVEWTWTDRPDEPACRTTKASPASSSGPTGTWTLPPARSAGRPSASASSTRSS
jgi:hypothetical protein